MVRDDGDDDYKKACGRRLAQAREALGYPVRADFARLLPAEFGMTEKHRYDRIEKIEIGAAFPSPRFLRYLKRRFGVSADWILDGDISPLPGGLQRKLLELHPDIAV